MSSTENKKCPWKDGIYTSNKWRSLLLKIEGGQVTTLYVIHLDYPEHIPEKADGTVEFGDFGNARKEVKEASGKQ